MRPPFSTLLAPFALASALGSARADALPGTERRPHTYAVVVGSNGGGAAQAPLRFAEDDARRFAEVLRDLGHFAPDDVSVLLHPDAAGITAALDALSAKLRARSGELSEVVFYYSGHARANALTLGGEEIPLATLRERLGGLPATLTIVVLDACQSGAFARVKGAEPAADFTYNSVARLTQKGLAVMASSTSQELGQESDELKASYFTHHLVSALRGAGDADGDGRVSLDEAYRYAYRRTLASTARTRVGEQHVTLETDLAGQGEVPVTYPAEARAQLELPAGLDARVLVQHRASGAVVAEVQKAKGAPVRLAFMSGAYDAVVAQGSGIVQCSLVLIDDRVTPLDPSACTPVSAGATATKGEEGDDALERPEFPPPRGVREVDRWAIEAAAGFNWAQRDGYTQSLEQFGYQRQEDLLALPSSRLTLGASRSLAPHFVGVLQLAMLSSDTYVRSVGGSSDTDTASMSAYGGAFYLRVQTDVFDRWIGVYAQAGGGVSLGFLNYKTQQTGVPPSTTDSYVGYLLGGAVGGTLRFRHVVTLFVQAGYDRAPAITNLIGDTHDSGGPSLVLGLRFRLGDDVP